MTKAEAQLAFECGMQIESEGDIGLISSIWRNEGAIVRWQQPAFFPLSLVPFGCLAINTIPQTKEP